jgi:hypothetical protein
MPDILRQRRELHVRAEFHSPDHETCQGQHNQEKRQEKNGDPDMTHEKKVKGKWERRKGKRERKKIKTSSTRS